MTTITLSGGAALTTEQKTALRVEIGAPTATDVTTAASNAIAAHASAADPHPQYMTQSEGDQRYAPAGITGATNLTATASPTGITVNSDTGTDAPLPLSDGTNAGLMAPAQHTKLAGMADGATANAADAALRDRSTHTGEQPIDSVTGLQAALDGKAPATHGHAISDVTGLATALGGKADLVDGKLPASQLPDLAVIDYLGAVGSQAAMLALTGQKGDWCTRTDLGTTWVIIGTPSVLAGWTQLSYPAAPVTSVAGRTGAVTLSAADISGLGTAATTAASAYATAAQGTKADSALQDLQGMQNAFISGTSSQQAAFQSSVSKGPVARVCRVILAAGQSNSKGADVPDATIDAGDSSTYQYCCNAATTATFKKIISANGLLQWTEDVANVLSPGQWLARQYSRMTGCPVLIVPSSFGATAMVGSRWQPGNPGGDLYENAIARANEAIAAATEMFGAAQFDGIYWVQGEGDGDNGKTQVEYATQFRLLIDGFRARITGAANSWFIVGSMPYETMQYYPETKPIYYAHRQVAGEKLRTVFVPSPRGYTISPGVNRHLTAQGARIMGMRMANAVPSAMLKLAADPVFTAPVAPGATSVSGITNTSAVLSWSAPTNGADDYTVQLSTDNGATWSTYARKFNDVPSETLVGLVKNTAYKTRISGTNPAGTGPYNAITSFQTANVNSLIPYTFESDTIGAAPAGMTFTTGGAVVLSSYSEKMIHTSAVVDNGGVAWYAILDNVPNTGTDQTVVWHRRTLSGIGIAHDRGGPILRRQNGYTAGTYSGFQQGYFFAYDSANGAMNIYRFNAAGIAAVGAGSGPAPAAYANSDLWFKAEAIGNTLRASYSTDGGTTWTVSFSGTDSTFASGGVGFGSILYTSSSAHYGEINVTQ